MVKLLLAFITGLVVGWNLLPQPLWVKSIYDKVKNFIKEKILKSAE